MGEVPVWWVWLPPWVLGVWLVLVLAAGGVAVRHCCCGILLCFALLYLCAAACCCVLASFIVCLCRLWPAVLRYVLPPPPSPHLNPRGDMVNVPLSGPVSSADIQSWSRYAFAVSNGVYVKVTDDKGIVMAKVLTEVLPSLTVSEAVRGAEDKKQPRETLSLFALRGLSRIVACKAVSKMPKIWSLPTHSHTRRE